VGVVMRESNYHLNKRASSLRKKMSGLIGLVLKRPEGGLRDDPFVSCLISEITEVLAGSDFHLCVDLAHTAEEQSRIYDEMLRTDRVDGVILVEPEAHDARLERLLADEFPFVVIGNPASAVVSSVDNDNVMAGRMAALHLVESGCRQVGMLAGPKDVQVSSDRVLGYNFAMQQAGQTPMIWHSDFGHKAAEMTAAGLISKPGRPDGLVVLDDHMAVGAASAIRSAGLSIPDDIALVSFNNSSLCDLVEGGLTSVDLNVESLIRQAARILLKRVESKNGTPISRRVVPCELVRRGSSSPRQKGGVE
jgi:DNA-binding LacI/PurR family transcriptional regulator